MCSTWWLSEEVLLENGIDELLMGMSSQIAEKEDHVMCSDVRGTFLVYVMHLSVTTTQKISKRSYEYESWHKLTFF